MIAQLRAVQGNEDAQLKPWVIHDLRRTATTTMRERLKIAPHVADRILNHSQGGVAGIYDRSVLLDERQAALDALGRYIAKLIDPDGAGNVVPIRGSMGA